MNEEMVNKEYIINLGEQLIDKCSTVFLGTNGEQGYPNIKAMLKMESEGIKTIWLSTNTSSKRIAQLSRNPKACVYIVDLEKRIGLMLIGHIDIKDDIESRQRIWREGFEKYYSKGVTDEDYRVLKFTSEHGNYYHRGMNISFEL